MVALLVLGALGILATAVLAASDRRPLWGPIAVAAAVYLATPATFLLSLDRFIEHAHFAAAIGLLVCIILVALVNRRRHASTPQAQAKPDRYGLVAWALMGVALLGIP